MYGQNLKGLEANLESVDKEFQEKCEVFIDVKESYDALEKFYTSHQKLFGNLDSVLTDLDTIVKRFLNTFIVNHQNEN